MRKLVDEWALKNKVDVELDFLTGIGNKINITMAAEAQAKTGHDVYAFDQWTVHEFADSLDPVDDIMKSLMGQYGPTSHAAEYLGVADGHWMAVPVGWGSAPLASCGRISLLKQHAGVDVQKWYPAEQSTPDAAKDWTYDTQLKMAEALFKGVSRSALAAGRAAPMPIRSGVRRSERSAPIWWMPRERSPPTPMPSWHAWNIARRWRSSCQPIR